MSDCLNCVFIPPDFHLYDILNIVYIQEEAPEHPFDLSITVNEAQYNLPSRLTGNRICWEFEAAGDFHTIAPDVQTFELISADKSPIQYNLKELIFLGPTKCASAPNDTFLLEFTSGIYARREDYQSDTVTFTVDSVLTLDYRNVMAIRQQLEELNAAQKTFEDTKSRLTTSEIDINELSNLKAQYEECMREKRRVQHEFLQQNQKMQAAMIHNQNEQDAKDALQSLKHHIEVNKQKIQQDEPEPENYKRLLRFRESALNELKMIFPYNETEKKLCNVQYNVQPQNVNQWNEQRAFLGFATHYIREVSRIVGIPLQYLLIPLAGMSQCICRLTDEKRVIPQDNSPQSLVKLTQYEESLISCVQHIAKTLMMTLPESKSITDFIQLIRCISVENLKTLIPEQPTTTSQ